MGPRAKSANKILDNESRVPLNASQGLCCDLGIISEPAHYVCLGPRHMFSRVSDDILKRNICWR